MSSELEHKTAIIVRSVGGPTAYSIATSFKESEDIEEGFLNTTMINDDPSVPMSTLQTVVKPWMIQIAAGSPYLYQQDGAPPHTSNFVQNWCLENLDMF
ncbi:Transposable element tcb1 transposase [Caligus rogercresseyi]|uniref:Transposable element tcb1 transposase n=1 Tax=Caligus rogercresseyi TaxID=217165 RepID=A0A7T8HGI3_CALRO|nr:Transposable element tcb1 transposase [Caligus rogercresseyi]